MTQALSSQLSAVSWTNHKAWMAGLLAAIVPIALQNLLGTGAAYSTIWAWFASAVFGTAAVEPQALADAFKEIVSAVGSGIGTGLATWWIANKPKLQQSPNEGEEHA